MFILDCNEVRQMCYNAKPILEVIKYLIKIIQWSVPIILILFGTWDMFKAVTKADDSKVVEEAKKSFIKRLIYGVLLFLVPFLVRLILNFVDDNFVLNEDTTSPTSWISCWNDIMNNASFSDCNNIYKKDIPDSQESDGSQVSSGGQSAQTKDCSGLSCPTSATFENASKKFDVVYYKNACYCRASIPSADLFDSSSCSNIKLNSSGYTFAFSESDKNSANDYCYYKATSSGGNSMTSE